MMSARRRKPEFADSAINVGAAEALAACLPHKGSSGVAWFTVCLLMSHSSPQQQLRRFCDAGWADAALSLLKQLLHSSAGESCASDLSSATVVLSLCLTHYEPCRHRLLKKGAVEVRGPPLPLFHSTYPASHSTRGADVK